MVCGPPKPSSRTTTLPLASHIEIITRFPCRPFLPYIANLNLSATIHPAWYSQGSRRAFRRVFTARMFLQVLFPTLGDAFTTLEDVPSRGDDPSPQRIFASLDLIIILPLHPLLIRINLFPITNYQPQVTDQPCCHNRSS